MSKFYHVTVLSNWLLGFDKYSLRYSRLDATDFI